MDEVIKKPLPAPLPTAAHDWVRATKTERTLNDMVEDIHMQLVENADYKALLYATWDEQAVEGSLSADNHEAARMIRERSKKVGYTELARQKLATISKALGVVLRRYGQSRKQRRQTVGGKIVPLEKEESNNGSIE